MLFKWFPDTEIHWLDVLPDAIATAVLFNLGKFAIGWYIGTQGLESTYGAAASIVVLLIWAYYSAQIVLFGARLTHAYATEKGSLRKMTDVNARMPHKANISRKSRQPRCGARFSPGIQLWHKVPNTAVARILPIKHPK
jgi:uncharacterized BrkB/YihY/UPF0761 family membrane protein